MSRCHRRSKPGTWVAIAIGLALAVPITHAQTMDVTFRWIPSEPVTRAFLPGEFNNWGPNSGGRIAPNAPSLMHLDSTSGEWVRTENLAVGRTYQYKIHVHRNSTGTDYSWITDPLNERTNPSEHNNSVITISDPMIFQMALHENARSEVTAVSAGVFGTREIATLSFSINGEARDGLPHLKDGIFRYSLPNNTDCNVQFTLTATDTEGNEVAAIVGLQPPAVQDAPRPAGVSDGVTYDAQNPSRATLSLFAPGKCFVHAIGDFNEWNLEDAPILYRDAARPDSVHWWITLDNLVPNQEIAYQYVIDGDLRIADLFADKILDPAHDRYIPAATYPNLKPYPTGHTKGHVAVMHPGRPAYDWTVESFDPPPQGELIIYELLLRDFLHAHDWATLTDTLAYLERLGVNAIELMPIAEFGGNINWGYQPQFIFAPDKYYGPADDLKRFIDAAHARGMAIILDVVYNHVDTPSPLVTLYGQTNANPFLNLPPRHPYNVFFDLNHEHPYTQYWLDRVNSWWLEEFKVDGFRFDLSKGFTQQYTRTNPGAWDAYDASRVRLIKRMADHIWSVNPRAYVILEHWSVDREERELAAYGTDRGLPGMMVWSNINGPYSEATMGYHDGGKSAFNWAYFGRGGRNWPLPHVITYMESHDEQWIMYRNRRYGACERSPQGGNACAPELAANSGTYNTRELSIALDRMKMAGAFFFLLPGPHMMWQFGEVGYGFGDRGEQCLEPYECPSFAPGRTSPKPIRWDYRSDTLREKLYGAWAALINLRRDHTVFHDPESEVTLDLGGPVKRIALSHPDMDAEIVGNFGVTPLPNRSRIGTPPRFWYDYFSGDSLDVTGDRPAMLMPGEFHIYTTKRLPLPESGLITVGVETAPPVPEAFGLHGNYPNPFRTETTIQFTLPSTQLARLEVFDLLGRRVATLAAEKRVAGFHEVVLDGAGLPSGVYAIRLTAGGRISVRAVHLER